MSRILRRVGAGIVALAFVVPALHGCGQTANVSNLSMALDGEALRKRSVFYTDTKEIHCVAELGVSRDGVTVEIIIRELEVHNIDDDTYDETGRVVAYQEHAPPRSQGKQMFDIAFAKTTPTGENGDDLPFRAGSYQCEIYLDGELKRTAAFSIEVPDCPEGPILSGSLCYGFYEANRCCPVWGRTAEDETTVVCDRTKGWQWQQCSQR